MKRQRQRMESLSVKLEAAVRAAIEAEAQRDRRRPSEVARLVLTDWARSQHGEARARQQAA